MNWKKFAVAMGMAALSAPALVWGDDASFAALLAQVPTPPKTLKEASLRWQEGSSVSGSQMGFDKSSKALLAKIEKLEKDEMTNGQKFGGETAQDLQSKMANMTQEEKIAYAMKLSQKMQGDASSAYQSKSMQQVAQNNAAAVQKSMAAETAAKAMSDLDQQYQGKFTALFEKMKADVKACPKVTVGEATGPDKACAQSVLSKYKADYGALTLKEMAQLSAIYADFKKSATAEIKGWEADIQSLEGSGTDTAGNEASRKKTMIYEEIRDLTLPADKAVDLGHEAQGLDPWKACGGDCLQD